MRDLGSRVLSALRWTAIARFTGQIISWAATIIVIRLIAPSDYGLMAIAAAIVTFLVLFNTLGMDAVLIQHRTIDRDLRRRIFGATIVLNAALLVGLLVCAPLLAAFFEQPRLTPVVRALALQFLFLIFETLPQTALERELNFRSKSLVDLATIVLGSLVTLAMAIAGYGVWALVAGNLTTVATRVAGLNLIAPIRELPSFSFAALRGHFRFGASVTSERGLWVVFNEADKFIGGKMMSQESLGFYAVAMHIASLPINKLSALLNSVAFPAFAQVQAQSERAAELILKGVRLLSFGAFPVFFGISAVAPEIVAVLLGERWQAAALPMQIAALIMPIRMLGNFMSSFLWGLGQPQISAGNLLLAALVMPVSFVVGAQYGPTGLSLAWLIVYPVVFVISLGRAARVVGISFGSFVTVSWRPALGGMTMYLAVEWARYALAAASPVNRLGVLLVVGIAVYLPLAYALDRATWQQLTELIHRQRI